MNKSFLIQSPLINVGIAAAFIGVQTVAANAADLQGRVTSAQGNDIVWEFKDDKLYSSFTLEAGQINADENLSLANFVDAAGMPIGNSITGDWWRVTSVSIELDDGAFVNDDDVAISYKVQHYKPPHPNLGEGLGLTLSADLDIDAGEAFLGRIQMAQDIKFHGRAHRDTLKATLTAISINLNQIDSWRFVADTKHPDIPYVNDPFLSLTLTNFDPSTGKLAIGGENATFDSGVPSELPIIDAIIDSDGEFTDDDPLLGALLDYSGIFLEGENGDGTFSFTDGLLEALNPSDPTDILFSADIVSILADPNTSMFSAKLRNFVPGSISPDSSPLLAEFISAGMGETWLDPAIIEVTESFSQAGTTSDVFLQDVVPSVPEPTSTLSFLALGTLGAASTFKRKLKPTKEKQLEKVS